MRYENVLEAVGNTPLIRLNRLAKGLKPRIYVKAEFMNPGGSVKDRIGVAMIDGAERKGLLKPFAVKVTRIAHGVPMGGDLDYMDARTLSCALTGRPEI